MRANKEWPLTAASKRKRAFGVVVKCIEYQPPNSAVAVRPTHFGHLQATLNTLLTYSVRRPIQPPIISGTRNE